MYVFVWENVDQMSDSYHSNGGVVVFAATEERARELANAENGCKIRPSEKPGYVRKVTGKEEMVIYMPNAGCC